MSYGKPQFSLKSKDIDPAELVDKVPYVGATQNVDIIDFGMSADFVDLNNPSIQSYGEGRIAWDTPEGTATFTTVVDSTSYGAQDFNVHIGQQDFFLGTTGGTILSNQAVYVIGARETNLGELRPDISMIFPDVQFDCIVGLAVNSAVDDENVYVQTYGMYFNINTLAYSVGDPIYALTDGSGDLTITPTNVYIGTVVSKAKAGSIFLNPKVFYAFSQFSDVYSDFSGDPKTKANIVYKKDTFTWRAKIRSITETTTGTTVTGTLSATITSSLVIDANTVQVNDIIRVRWRLGKSINTANTTMAIFINTTNSLSGATAMGIVSNANGGFSQMKRDFSIKGATTECYPVTLTANTDDSTATNLPATPTIDWTVDQYVIFSLQNSVITDSGAGQYFNISFERGKVG
jgi:hypothetical protein